MHVEVYAGVPRANHALKIAKEIFAAMDAQGGGFMSYKPNAKYLPPSAGPERPGLQVEPVAQSAKAARRASTRDPVGNGTGPGLPS